MSIHDADSALAPGNQNRPGCLIPENNFCCNCKDVVRISPPLGYQPILSLPFEITR